MSSNADDSNDAVLSDVEDDDPVAIEVSSTSPDDFSVEKFREVSAELVREREAREALEVSKSELQVSFNRLKALAHEAIRKRDETNRVKDEALREKDEAVRVSERLRIERDEAVRANEKLKLELEEVVRVRDEVTEKCDEAVRGKETLRGEVETGARMLMNGIEKISGKVSGFKDFSVGGLPRSQKYTGLPAVAYGVIKRTNEIVEEMIRQVDLIAKERDEAREQMEQRNYEIAIEVSQLEATIDGLKEEVGKKGSVVEELEKLVAEKDGKLRDLEKEILEKKGLANDELAKLRELFDESEGKLKNLELKMDSQRPLLVEQLKYVAKIHDQIDNVIKVVDGNKLDQSELSESLFLPKETDMEENIRASLAGMESIYELSRNVVEKTRELVEERSNEVKRLNNTVSQLVKEKEHIGTLLRSALSKRVSADLSSKTNELFKVAENGLKEAGIDYKFSNHMGDGKGLPSNDKEGALVAEEDEIYTLAGALENIIKQSQLEIIELKHTVDELGAEANLLKQHVEAQAKELVQRKQKLEELEEKERVANDNVTCLYISC
ncbi:hypothetical protein AgCh_001927 [Apium graveolens]